MNGPANEHGPAAQPGDGPSTGTEEREDLESRGSLPEPDFRTWWQQSAAAAAGASLAIGAATLWFGGMLSRVPLDAQASFGYLLMLPLLLIVPAFSLAGLRLSWTAFGNRLTDARAIIVIVALTAGLCNLLAIARFSVALVRIFAN
jgi:hypothetical protein